MRRVVLACGILVWLCAPAAAFDFHPRDFAVMYDDEAHKEGRHSGLNEISCDRRSPYDCDYRGHGDTVVHVAGADAIGHTKMVAMLLTADTAADKELLTDAPFILTAMLSPNFTDEERRQVIRQVVPGSIVTGASPSSAVLGKVRYTAAVISGPILVLGAIDTAE